MSGGSFDYLCYKDFPEICERKDSIREMSERLTELGHLDAAKETEKILLDIDAFEVRIKAKMERLEMVWKSVEWFDSGDWGVEDVTFHVEQYQSGKK